MLGTHLKHTHTHTYLFLGWVNTFRQLAGELVDQIVGWKGRIAFLTFSTVLLLESHIKLQVKTLMCPRAFVSMSLTVVTLKRLLETQGKRMVDRPVEFRVY